MGNTYTVTVRASTVSRDSIASITIVEIFFDFDNYNKGNCSIVPCHPDPTSLFVTLNPPRAVPLDPNFNFLLLPLPGRVVSREFIFTFTAPPTSGQLSIYGRHISTSLFDGSRPPPFPVIFDNNYRDGQTIQVGELVTLELILTVPGTVEAGSTFEVDVRTDLPVPVGSEVSVMVTFDGMDETETGTLSANETSVTVTFTAPDTRTETFTVSAVGMVSVKGPDVLQLDVTSATASVEVVPVAIALTLDAPAVVLVGSSFTVAVDTDHTLPTGTEVEVRVLFGTASDTVELNDMVATTSVEFMAPASAGLVNLVATATVTTQGVPVAAVLDAAPLEVSVSAREVQLVLSELPSGPVATDSTFTVTVGTESALPDGTAVTVMASLADFTSEPVELSPTAATAAILVTAPAAGGPATLTAEGAEAVSSALELNVLPSAARIQVQEQILLVLSLEAPRAVTARDSFDLRVSTEPAVPAGALVAVRVGFDETDSSQVELTAGDDFAVVTLRAPGRLADDLALTASGVATVEDSDVLRVTVMPISIPVDIVPQSAQLALVAPAVVNAGAEFAVTVSVSPTLLADTTLTVGVTFNEVTVEAILTDTMASQQVRFTAPASGRLDVSARVLAEEPAGLVVAEDAPRQVVQVRRLVALGLTLSVPETVEAGSTFDVAVETDLPVPAGAAVSVVVTFDGDTDGDTQVAMLSANEASQMVSFTAPGMTGTFEVRAAGRPSVMNENALRLNVTRAVASVVVEPVSIMLIILDAPGVVRENSSFTVMVGTDPVLPIGTQVEVRVEFGNTFDRVELSDTITTASADLTAPSSAGVEVVDLMTAATITTQGVPVSEVVDAVVPVRVREEGTIGLTLSVLETVAAGSTFSVEVGTDLALSGNTTVMVTVTFEEAEETVELTADDESQIVPFTVPGTTGTFAVQARGEAVIDPSEAFRVDGTSASVVVVPVPIRLTLSAPGVVDADSIFTVMVGTDPVLPTGTEVGVRVQFGSAMATVELGDTVATTMVEFTAPSSGLLDLTAEVSATTRGALAVNVSDAALRVRVTELVSLSLQLEVPPTVMAGDSFELRVSTEPAVPVGVTVTVTVRFDQTDSEPVELTAGVTSAAVTLRVPDRVVENLVLTASGVATEADPDALRVSVARVSTEVTVVAQSVQILLMVPAAVDADEVFVVTVSVSPALLAGTTLTVEVTSGAVSERVILTDTVASQQLRFTAPASGQLELSARALAVEAEGLVATANAPVQRRAVLTSLDFIRPSGVNVDDLVLVLRYLQLRKAAAPSALPLTEELRNELVRNLPGEIRTERLDELSTLLLPDVNQSGDVGDIEDLIILFSALSVGEDFFLRDADNPGELRIIFQRVLE